MKTLVIDNFNGSMTQFVNGDINSGLASVYESSGYAPFDYPGRLTWGTDSEQIDPNGSVITDMILDGQLRVESNIVYVYAIGHTGRLYKIQVNDPVTYNPDYDNPVLLATLTQESPTFTRGGFIDFFGSTERIYIGHDKGVTRIDFDGTNETFVGAVGSWTQTVPRPLQQFLGNLYAGNGNNLTEIISAGTVSTYAKLSPAFPSGTQVRDLDVSPEGNYLESVVTRLALPDITSSTQNPGEASNSESYTFRWNGVDTGYTSFNTFPKFSLTANTLFQNNQYTFGYDQNGGAVFNPNDKILSLQEVIAPMPNAISSVGNMVTFFSPVYFGGFLEGELFYFGTGDFEVGTRFYDLFFQLATGTETDVVRIPCQIPIANFGVGASSNGYTDNVFSTPKIYFSTLETSPAPTTKYKLYKWFPKSTPFFNPDAFVDAVYQTQSQLFSKKIRISEVRVYGEPWSSGVSFKIDLIGSNLSPMTNGSYTFTVGSTLESGQDYAWYNPSCAPTYTVALRITNLGTTNHIINKIEIDYDAAGK